MTSTTTNNDDIIEIDLQELIGLVIHWLWLIVLCGLITGAAGFAISHFVIVPEYESTTKVYILNKQENSTLTYSDVQLGTQLTKDYAQLIKSRTVLEQVINTCALTENYESFSGRVSVETLTDTRIIAITVTDTDPVMAQLLANEIRGVASEHIKNVMDIQAVNVAEEANLPAEPSSPSVLKWTAIGLLLGMFLCAMVVIIRFLLDDTIKTGDDVEKYLELSTLAMIPVMNSETHGKNRKKKSSDNNSAKSGKEIREMDADGNPDEDGKNEYDAAEQDDKSTGDTKGDDLVVEELVKFAVGEEK